jgi:hypothetical protein
MHEAGAMRGGQAFAGGEEDGEDVGDAARPGAGPARDRLAMKTPSPKVPTSCTATTLG